MTSEAHGSGLAFRLLHTLRCIGVASEDRVAFATGLPADETVIHLRRLADQGLVALASGPFGGWSLTDDGRVAGQELLDAELKVTDARDHMRKCYESFLRLNPTLLQICSDWQMRKIGNTQALNDHTDADYDAIVLSRLMRIDDSVQRVCEDLASRLKRFGVYSIRLSTALDQAVAGDRRYISDSVDSYHTVWFQLHEDLLATLGISRDDERRGTAAAD